MSLKAHLTEWGATIKGKSVVFIRDMAGWAGTGPGDKTCKDCQFYDVWDGDYLPLMRGRLYWVHSSKNAEKGGKLRPQKCLKYLEIVGKSGKPIPPDAPSCDKFLQADYPHPMTSREWSNCNNKPSLKEINDFKRMLDGA